MKFKLEASRKRCLKYRKRILELSQNVSALHIGGTFSCTEVLDVIYNSLMKKNEIDSFVLSKGHASILQYVILEDLKILKKKDVDNYCKKEGFLGVHPDVGNPGINASTGSLGHGLGMAAGMALANKKKTVYCVLSDGELQEGSTWEAIMLIPALKLKNIIIVVDNNNLQSLEKTSDTHPNLYPIEEKFDSFGWFSKVCNGHNANEIFKKINQRDKLKPMALIAKTIKGYPVSFMQNNPIWHYRSPNKLEYKKAINELDSKL